MIISIDSEKAFDQTWHPFMRKALKKLEIKGLYPNIIKAKYDKLKANIILSGKNWNHFL
jgi:hypothetical protein